AGNWMLVDALSQDAQRSASDVTDANNWRTLFSTPALTLHGEAGPALQAFVSGLGIVNIPTYIVVAPDGTVGAVVEGFSQNQPLIDAVAAVWAAYVARPPVIAAKPDVIVETKLAPIRVGYTSPTAVDAIDGNVAVSCLPKTLSLFPFGKSLIDCA